jgi:hypothetical protein
MKKLIIAVAALMVSIAAYGQGQFVFNNRVLPDINARFVASTDPAGGTTSSIGTDYTVQLFNGTAALDPASTTFRGAAGTAAAGYVTPTTETVAGVAPGAAANITLKVVGPNIQGGSQNFGPYAVTLGGGTITPPNLALGTQPLTVSLGVIPEPTTLALGLLGLGALGLAIRRR